jgi:hypothetical protein
MRTGTHSAANGRVNGPSSGTLIAPTCPRDSRPSARKRVRPPAARRDAILSATSTEVLPLSL